MRPTPIVFAFVSALCASLIPFAAEARRAPEGAFLELGGVAARFSYESDVVDESDTGFGGRLALGWGLTSVFSLFGSAELSSIDGERNPSFQDRYTLTQFEAGARIRWPRSIGPDLIPFLDLSTVYTRVRYDEAREFSADGYGAAGGLGAHYFINPDTAITLRVGYLYGGFHELDFGSFSVEVDEDDWRYNVTRASIGLTFFVM